MIPGKSSSCMFAPLYSMTPGMQVSVVNSYEAWTDSVLVMVLSRVDFPTEGKPIMATRASPDLSTSNPSPFSPFFPVGSSS